MPTTRANLHQRVDRFTCGFCRLPEPLAGMPTKPEGGPHPANCRTHKEVELTDPVNRVHWVADALAQLLEPGGNLRGFQAARRDKQVGHARANLWPHMNDASGLDDAAAFFPAGPVARLMSTDLPFAKGAVVGLGVVGIPVAAKMAEAGIVTMGLDVDEPRVAAIAAGRYPFDSEEPGIHELIKTAHASGRLSATTDAKMAIADADVVIVVVQTPVDPTGVPRYAALKAALGSIGPHLKQGALVVVESTLAPGTMRGVVQPAIEASSGKQAGIDFLLGHCPERVMPGKLLRNITMYDRVVGGYDEASTERMLTLYRLWVQGTLTPTEMTTAEVVKTTENAYRDVQIAFANEVAHICQVLGVDAWEVRQHVNRVEDRNMHLPGTGVGGHCIPKDGLLLASSAAAHFDAPLLRAARQVNDAMPRVTADLAAEAFGAHDSSGASLRDRRVVVLGASYLPGSDDTRDAPTIALAAALDDMGAQVVLVDPHVTTLAHRAVTADLITSLDGADVVILATAHQEYLTPDWKAWLKRMRTPVVIDGRGAWDPAAARGAGFTYRGIGR